MHTISARKLSSAVSQCCVCWDEGASTESALKETRLQSASRPALQSYTIVADCIHMDNCAAVLCHTHSLVRKRCGLLPAKIDPHNRQSA